MKKWLIIGGIASTLVIGVAVLGIAVYTLMPRLAYAQQGPQATPGTSQGIMPFAGRRGPGGPMDQFGHGWDGPAGWFGGKIDRQALLANALGITVEELQAAEEKAQEAAIQQAVDQGSITQDQADLMTAAAKLRSYVNRDTLLAKALGMTPEELQAARDAGKPLAVIIYDQGLTPATLRTKLQTAYQEAVQQAVTDGVITQAQAEQLTNQAGNGPAGFPGRGDFNGPRRGGFGEPRGNFGGFGSW